MPIKPFKYQIAVGDWLMYNPGLYDWIIASHPWLSNSMRDDYKLKTSLKYKVYDIGIFKRSGLVEVRLQDKCHVGTDIIFTHTLNPDGTCVDQGFKGFMDQLLVKVTK
jgi:hypothetical protein